MNAVQCSVCLFVSTVRFYFPSYTDFCFGTYERQIELRYQIILYFIVLFCFVLYCIMHYICIYVYRYVYIYIYIYICI